MESVRIWDWTLWATTKLNFPVWRDFVTSVVIVSFGSIVSFRFLCFLCKISAKDASRISLFSVGLSPCVCVCDYSSRFVQVWRGGTLEGRGHPPKGLRSQYSPTRTIQRVNERLVLLLRWLSIGAQGCEAECGLRSSPHQTRAHKLKHKCFDVAWV